jgi:hypothetical protein
MAVADDEGAYAFQPFVASHNKVIGGIHRPILR